MSLTTPKDTSQNGGSRSTFVQLEQVASLPKDELADRGAREARSRTTC
jgi:hypothetical protein